MGREIDFDISVKWKHSIQRPLSDRIRGPYFSDSKCHRKEITKENSECLFQSRTMIVKNPHQNKVEWRNWIDSIPFRPPPLLTPHCFAIHDSPIATTDVPLSSSIAFVRGEDYLCTQLLLVVFFWWLFQPRRHKYFPPFCPLFCFDSWACCLQRIILFQSYF